MSATLTASPVPRAGALLDELDRDVAGELLLQRLGDVLGGVTDHHDDALQRQPLERVEHVEEHRAAAERVQHLRRGRAHAGALARRQHHCAHRSDLRCHSVHRSPSLGVLGGEVSNLDLGLQRTPCCRYTTPDRSITTVPDVRHSRLCPTSLQPAMGSLIKKRRKRMRKKKHKKLLKKTRWQRRQQGR